MSEKLTVLLGGNSRLTPNIRVRSYKSALLFRLEPALCYFLPFLIAVLIAAILMCQALWKNRSVSAIEITTPGQSRFRTVTIMFAGILVSQLVLGSPGILENLDLGFRKNHDLQKVLLALTFMNNGVNFYIYIISARGFRKTFIEQFYLMKNKIRNTICPAS